VAVIHELIEVFLRKLQEVFRLVNRKQIGLIKRNVSADLAKQLLNVVVSRVTLTTKRMIHTYIQLPNQT
jgi:hypothetical protein